MPDAFVPDPFVVEHIIPLSAGGKTRLPNDALLIVGLTPIGRATVETLKLNHQKMVNLRRVLLLAGLHPLLEELSG